MMSDAIFKSVETDEEYFAAWRLVLQTFREDSSDRAVAERVERTRQQPGFDFAKHQIALVDDQVVSHVMAHDLRLSYGSCSLRMGGVAGVCTHPAHRDQGYALRLMEQTLDFMRARGDHFALLNTGTSGFYSRVGYDSVWSDSWMQIQAEDAAALAAPLPVRSMVEADLPQVAALYAQHWAGRCTMPRSAEVWHWYTIRRPERVALVVEAEGSLRAYAISTFAAGSGMEVVADSPEALISLLSHLGQMALAAEDWPRIEIMMAPDDPLLHYVRWHVSGVLNTAYTYQSNWMARLVNADAFREAILPELTRQAGIDSRGLIFEIQPAWVEIALRGQDSADIILDLPRFMQLVFGTLPPEVLQLGPDAVHLLARLFPRRPLMIAPLDWF